MRELGPHLGLTLGRVWADLARDGVVPCRRDGGVARGSPSPERLRLACL